MKQKILICLLFVGLFFGLGLNVLAVDVWGWAWSENIGWISFNCLNDYDDDGIRDDHCIGINPGTGLSYINYGVNIDSAGLFSGYAWSEHIGWISFNGADLEDCPFGTCEARIELDPVSPNYGRVIGWAKYMLEKESESFFSPYDFGLQFRNLVFQPQNTHAQSFTIGTTGPNENFDVSRVELLLHRSASGTPIDIEVDIRGVDESSGDPVWFPGSPDLCFGTVNSDRIPTSTGKWTEIIISPGCSLLAGKKYAIVVKSGLWEDGEHIVAFEASRTSVHGDAYTGGDYRYEGGPNLWINGSVMDVSDFKFKIWGKGSNWIKLNPTAAGSNGVRLIGSDFHGWAYGGADTFDEAIIGWLSFNSKNCDPNGDGNPSDGPAECVEAGRDYSINPIPNYKVMIGLVISAPPSADELNAGAIYGCGFSPIVRFSWTYSGSSPQSAYEIQIDDDPNLDESPLATLTGGADNSRDYVGLNYNTDYWWRLKVRDSDDQWSGWIYPSPLSFNTGSRWPVPDFDWDPSDPLAGQEVQFNNQTQYCGAGGCSWNWNFDDGNFSTAENPSHIFGTEGTYGVKLTATNVLGSCDRTKSVDVAVVAALPRPKWQEVAPTF